MIPWKGIYDATLEGRGIYYGRVVFVRAADVDAARLAMHDAALAEFPGHLIREVGLGPSTEGAAASHALAREFTVRWIQRNRDRQHLLCPTCRGTGLR